MDQVVRSLAFLHEPAHPHLQGLTHEPGVFDAGQQDDGAGGSDAGDFAGGIHAVEHGHGDVQDGDVGRESPHRVHRGAPVRLIRHNLEAPFLQECPQGLAEDQMIIRQHQPNRHAMLPVATTHNASPEGARPVCLPGLTRVSPCFLYIASASLESVRARASFAARKHL